LIENNKISLLADELKLSAFSKINFFNDTIVMARDGTITSKGSIIALGGIKTNNISAVNEGDDINIKLKTQNSPSESEGKTTTQNSKLNIIDQLGSINASVDASGSAKFKELALEQFNPATPEATVIAASQNFIKNGIFASAIETATASAGVGILPAGQQEILIYNDRIRDNSLIYLTPINQINGQLNVVKSQRYFKVINNQISNQDIKFNWLIIN
jgi:hypothetical protein